MTFKKIIFFAIFLSVHSYLFAQDGTNELITSATNNRFRAVAEIGFLGVLDHKIQFSNSGTYFDYREEGGQDVLFPISRLSMEFDFNERNTLVFLYQPLRLESQVLLENDLIVDDLTFPASTSVKLLYNFPFYRLSYLRELLPNNEKYKLAIGGTLQIRNATISFESADGTQFRTNRDIGPVPAFKLRGKSHLNDHFYLELEADGIYAPISYLNGSDNEVVGAILDASFRSVVKVNDPVRAFLNLRYLGGGAVGTSDDEKGPGDGYVRNWLHFATVSLGFVYEWD
jgi:hypothetical protein